MTFRHVSSFGFEDFSFLLRFESPFNLVIPNGARYVALNSSPVRPSRRIRKMIFLLLVGIRGACCILVLWMWPSAFLSPALDTCPLCVKGAVVCGPTIITIVNNVFLRSSNRLVLILS